MKNPGRFSSWAGGTCIEVRMVRTCWARAGSSFGHNDGSFGSIFIAGKRVLFMSSTTRLAPSMSRTPSLHNLGNNGRGDARVSERDAAAAVRNLDAPEKGVLLLGCDAFACERGCARCSADKVAARQRHDTARAIVVVERAKCRPGSGRA